MKTLPFFFNQCLDKKRLKKLILWSLSFQGEYKTLQMIEDLKTLGFQYATSAGVSLSIDDLTIPPKKRTEVLESEALILQSVQGRAQGNRTAIEEIQTVVDTWHRTSETVKDHVIDFFEATNVLNPVYMMAFSGARGNVSQVRQLVGMRGLMADPKGDIIGYAIRSNFREGLTITEYMISAYGARKGVVDTALRTADAGYLTRRLVDVAQHIIVQQGSCGTDDGILLQPIVDGGKVVLKVEDRLLGRVLARDLYIGGKKMASRNDAIDHGLVYDITNAPKDREKKELEIYVRSPLTCLLSYGVCQLCYGWSFTQNRMVPIGEAVGVMAGQSIGEPGTQLTMRTFHTGGVFTGEVQDEFRSPHGGVIHYPKAFPGVLVRTPYGQIAFLVKEAGTLVIRDETHNKETVLDVPTHTALFLREGEKVRGNQVLALPGGRDGQGNDKVETRKIVFSEFDGEVFFQNVAQKTTPYPEKLSEKERRLEAEKRRRRTHRRQYMGELRAEKYRVKKYYTLTSRVGTMWILAGRKLDPTYKILSVFHTSGQLVDTDTVVSRDAVIAPAEGFIVRTNKADPTRSKPVLLPPGPQYQLDQHIDESALVKTIKPLDIPCAAEAHIYQPCTHLPFTKVNFDALQNNFAVRGKGGEILVIPDYTEQIRDEETRHHLDHSSYGATGRLNRVLYPWAKKLGWRGSKLYSHARNLSIFYFQADDKIQEAGVFLWKQMLFADVRRKHGLFMLTPYTFQEVGNKSVDAVTVNYAWTALRRKPVKVTSTPKRAIAAKTIWCNEGEAFYMQPNLQGQGQPRTAARAGVCTLTTIENTTTLSVAPIIKVQNPEAPRYNPLGDNEGMMGTVNVPFPFGQKPQTFPSTIIEHVPGWLYLPTSPSALAPAYTLPQFPGQTITSKPILMPMECRNEVPVDRKTHESVYLKALDLAPTSPVPEGVIDQTSRLSAIRLVSVLRHPRLIPLIKESPTKVKQAITDYVVISHPKSTRYSIFGTNESRLEKETGRLAQCLFGYVFDPMLTAVQKHIQHAPAGRPQGQRTHLLSFGLLYQPMAEFSLDRVSHTWKKLKNSPNFELGPMTAYQPLTARLEVSDLSDQTSIYTAFQAAYSEDTDNPPRVGIRKFITRAVWSKQIPSRLMPNERPRRFSVAPLLLPNRSYLEQPGFICRFLLQFEPRLERNEKAGHWKLTWSPPWQQPTDKVTDSSITINFVKQPPLHTKEDEIFHPPATWLMYGEPFIRRCQRSRTRGEVYRTASNDCVVLEKRDVQTFAFSKSMAASTVAIGDIIRFGDEIEPGVGIPAAGQIIALTPTTVTVRKGQPILFYNSGSIHVKNYECIPKGHPLVTLSYQRLITGDIVQGIPKVEQLFEGSQAKDKDTEIKLSQLLVTKFRTDLDKNVPPNKAYNDSVRMIQHKIIENIQKVYLSQGVSIADIHFEVIVRRMTAWGKIRHVGDSGLFRHEIMPIHRIEKVNAGLAYIKIENPKIPEYLDWLKEESTKDNKKGEWALKGIIAKKALKKFQGNKNDTKDVLAIYEPVIVGISASASNAESFLSAASFQETSRVLTRDAIEGKTDFLRGVKERVIVGDLIPAGTGFIEHAAFIATPPPLQSL